MTDGATATTTERRKDEHLRVVLEEDVRGDGITAGFERYRLPHHALPEINLTDVDTGTTFLDHRLRAPILVSCMTGGVANAHEINRRLAATAAAHGCAMGVGSQRAAIENPDLAAFFRLRDVAPGIPLFANLGAVQLNYGFGVDQCRRAVEMIEADALVFHLNPLQEALQAGGNVNFADLVGKIETVCAHLGVPVIVKEVGWGISAQVARQLMEVGVAAIDVAGAGGTSWSEVERHRAGTSLQRRVSAAFAGWGIPTAACVREVRAAGPTVPLIASGGLRTGVDVAKAIALGADLAGFAAPLLKAAAVSSDAAHEALAALIEQLRISMFCCGAHDVAHLHRIALDVAMTDPTTSPA